MRLNLVYMCLVLLLASCQEVDTPQAATAEAPAGLVQETQNRLEATAGGRLVLRAIDAHGGLAAWYNAPTSSYTWEYSNAGANIRFKSLLVADNRTRQVYHQLLEMGTPDAPKEVSGRFTWDGTDAWISPDTLKQPNPRFWATTGYYFESIPFILADPGLIYDVIPEEDLDGKLYDMVKVSYSEGIGDSPNDHYILFINKETSMVDAIRYTVTFGRGAAESGAPLRETLFYYEDYTEVDGLKVARRFRGFNVLDGVVTDFKNEAWADSFSFREPFDASQLVMPANGRVQPLPTRAD
ncbi:MAG: hypothetical protein AB8G77_16200 [Rhodothermales bacterium]